MIVQEVMTEKPYVASVRDSLRTVLSKLAEADVRHLPVTEDGELGEALRQAAFRALLRRARVDP